MEYFQLMLLASIVIISLVILAELFAPNLTTEGFSNLPTTTFWSSFAAPRSDIDKYQENTNFVRDPRYYNDYADVSRLGTPYDFCRMVAPSNDLTNLFFACALAGTENLTSTSFRTPGVKEGFRISYDDYMRDINGDGRDDYCRILKWSDNTFQPVCSYAGDMGFDSKERIDSKPPEDIKTLLTFYDSCLLWFRFKGDMLDTIDKTKATVAGDMRIDETPRLSSADGIRFNGVDQYLRLTDSNDFSLGTKVFLRTIKTWMCWVYFDAFTNNAKIFDFGNGAGMDNVFLGIVGMGDTNAQLSDANLAPKCQEDQESTVPSRPSGAQPVEEMSPLELMTTTDANINEYTSISYLTPKDYALANNPPKRLSLTPPASGSGSAPGFTVVTTATLIYEVWDKQDRKMSIKLPTAIPLGQWTHVTVTTKGSDPFRPDINIFINGKFMLEKKTGWLPATSKMTNCYLGKSNWADVTSTYENQDQLFKGRLFDFRAYKKGVSADMIKESVKWGKEKLGIK